jgi:HK97 family phage major capsid protein
LSGFFIGVNMKNDRANELSKKIGILEAEKEAIKKKLADEQRAMTPEEKKRVGEILTEWRSLTEELALENEELAIDELSNRARAQATKPIPESEDELQRRYPGLPSKQLRYTSLSEQVRDIMDAHPSMKGIYSQKLQASVRANSGMGITSPSDGGFAIQPNISSRLIEPLFAQGGDAVLSRLRQTNVTSGNDMSFIAVDETTQSGSVWGGITMYWLGESDLRTASAAKLRKVQLKLKDVAGLMYLTNDLMKDAPALAQRLETGFRTSLRNELVRVIMRGTGAGQPLGFLNSTAIVAIAAETGQPATTILTDNLLKMRERITPGTNPVWLYNPTCYKELFKLQVGLGTAGALVSGQTIQSSGFQNLLGYPAVECPWCSVLGTVGDIVLVDLNQYEFLHQGGEEIAYSAHVRFIYDEMAMRLVYRCDGQMSAVSAVTSPDGSTTVAPVITLATRS